MTTKNHNILFLSFLIMFLFFGCVNALKIGEEKPSLVNNIIITNENWADYIAATEYAYKLNGIILQTEGNKLNPNVENIIRSINPKKIIIVGGPLVVSKNIENKLKKYGKVIRIWGPTRVETDEKILKLLNSNNTKVLVNGYNFSEVVGIASNEYIPVYTAVNVYNPNDVIRVYENNTVKIYDIHNKRFIGEYNKSEVLEIPHKIIVLNKPNIDVKYCYNKDIQAYGYPMININSDNYNYILMKKNDVSLLLLSKYLNISINSINITNQYSKNSMFQFDSNAVNNSITVAVDILVIKKTLEIYRQNGNLGQSLNEAKTQLWSKNIPVDKYNIPYDYLKNYIKKI
ncbi:cell wall-binding repeat-containing protein [Methanothermococcus sp.]|uniref:cell wall-binding repeat-containing protein n=1 Tax=Methanothermococcus sp. TaxID=2614238 RepID=UPI0025F0B9FD|nr:cell wall-binding repeat-containing protein [Methanothermococcus sp.]